MTRRWTRRVAAAWLLVAAGCAVRAPVGDVPAGAASARPGSAEVVFVRVDQGYVVVRGEHLPNAGKEAKVFRDEVPVGMVRFTARREGDHAAADVVEGVLLPRDRVIY